jgi:hypothetical protein
MSERRFNDQEVAKILESALSENMDRALPARTSEGMTLAELQDIAREVGIDPVGVERAALALSEPAGRRSPMLGAPTTVQHERTVEGEVSQEHMQELVTTIRRVMARQGVVSVELDSLEWRARDALGARYVSITPGKGRTLIRALGNFRDGVAALFGGGTVLGLAAPVVAAAAFFPARFVWRRKARQEEDDLRAVVARLAEQLAGEFERPPHGGADD